MIIITIKNDDGTERYEQFLTKDIEGVRERIKELKEMGILKEDIAIMGYNFSSSGDRQNLHSRG